MNNVTPPPFSPPGPPNAIPDLPMYGRRNKSSGVGVAAVVIFGLLAVATAGVILFAGPTSAVRQIVKSPNEKAVLRWLDENEGDPDSVEIIAIDGPKYMAGSEYMRAKYRSTGPLGGPVVSEMALLMVDGHAEKPLTNHAASVWNQLEYANKFESMKEDLIQYAQYEIRNEAEKQGMPNALPSWRRLANPAVRDFADHWEVAGEFDITITHVDRSKLMFRDGRESYPETKEHRNYRAIVTIPKNKDGFIDEGSIATLTKN